MLIEWAQPNGANIKRKRILWRDRQHKNDGKANVFNQTRLSSNWHFTCNRKIYGVCNALLFITRRWSRHALDGIALIANFPKEASHEILIRFHNWHECLMCFGAAKLNCMHRHEQKLRCFMQRRAMFGFQFIFASNVWLMHFTTRTKYNTSASHSALLRFLDLEHIDCLNLTIVVFRVDFTSEYCIIFGWISWWFLPQNHKVY